MLEASENNQLPAIPGKRYFTIGEVSDLCGVKPHVLRYWEQEFPDLSPVKRRGNRRYYQRQDVVLIRQIRSLLHEQGFTIGGARQKLGDAPSKKELTPQEVCLHQLEMYPEAKAKAATKETKVPSCADYDLTAPNSPNVISAMPTTGGSWWET